MRIEFNYRYMLDEVRYESYCYHFTQCEDKKIAYQLEQVGEVVAYAERQQQMGNFVVLYLPYEASTYFNSQMATMHLNEGEVYAAAYTFKEAEPMDASSSPDKFHKQCNFEFQLSNDQLIRHIRTVQENIKTGNTYQVNYTTRLTDNIHVPIAQLYEALQRKQHGHYVSLIDTEELQVASLSPELFFQRGPFKGEVDVIVSKPMKGTMPRGRTKEEDITHFNQLETSSKDKAENVMIVDLLRNDIGRIAKMGTVNVYKMFNIESYPTVYQMTSMVAGQVEPHTSLLQILTGLFPCGSITGAPKVNTMKYIKALEQVPRRIYCGTIGLMKPDGKSIFNVPIRTIQYVNQQAVYGVGSGITIDSVPEREVEEFKDKTKILESI